MGCAVSVNPAAGVAYTAGADGSPWPGRQGVVRGNPV